MTRNPAALADVSSKFVKSSLHSILASGIESGNAFRIKNPDYQGTKGESDFLEGTPAYLKVVSQSIVGTGYTPNSVMNPLLESINGRWPGEEKSKVGDGKNLFTHNNIGYSIDEQAPSLGEKAVAIESELTPNEKSIYIERGTLLKQSINEPALTIGFQFDIPNKLSGYSFVQTNSYHTDEYAKADTSVQAELITAESQKAYISAALIECLLMLTDVNNGIKVNGTFALNRAVLSESDKTSRNSNPENGIDKNSTNAISDHVFGRAFDIRSVGDYDSIGGSKAKYAMVLDLVLQKLNTMPMPLIPDLIIIHPDVAKDKGIGEGFESLDSAIKTQYPQLKHVNFEFGPEHTDNIHISFGPKRGGNYIASSGAGWKVEGASVQSAQDNGGLTDATASAAAAKEKAYSNYRDGGAAISSQELFSMLTELGPFSHEAAAIFCAVTARESAESASAYNGKCSEGATSWGGDVSIGLFQFNLISLINKTNNTAKKVAIYFTPKGTAEIEAHKLAYAKPEAATWDPNAVAKQLVSIYNQENDKIASKSSTSDLLWYPINQVWMLIDKWGWTLKQTENKKIDTSIGFYHWGDYPKDVELEQSRSECGFIFKTKFQNAVNVYLTTGKPIETLHEWVRKNLKANNPRTVPYIEEWMQGKVFYDHKVNGTLIDESASGIITYETGVVKAQGAGDDGGSPTFTKNQIKEAADWISANRVQQWLSKYRTDLDGNFQCDRFARVLSAALGLFGATAQTTLFTEEWVAAGSGENATVATPSLQQFASAKTHLDNLESSEYFFSVGTAEAADPPAGYLVFWKGGQDDYGHVGISVGNGQYVDQHSETNRERPRSITSKTFPGSGYTYVGASSKWSV